ncbi:uncharacterized protein LOC141886465 isoform X5 [Acropora palmata]|uniref:uncharacterized protein LOC141886465 isoform X5 n=1 Tax=Acropora palmata TaxID=6131 RepID=UPI003DA176CA
MSTENGTSRFWNSKSLRWKMCSNYPGIKLEPARQSHTTVGERMAGLKTTSAGEHASSKSQQTSSGMWASQRRQLVFLLM